MATRWQDISEVVVGRILDGAYSAGAIDNHCVTEPYPQLLEELRKKKLEPDEILDLIGLNAYEAAINAANRVNGQGVDWIKLCYTAWRRHTSGDILGRLSKKLLNGEEIENAQLQQVIDKLESGQEYGLQRLSEIDDENDPHGLVGWPPIDVHLGGLPRSGLVTIGAAPGSGKTSLLIKIASCYAKAKRNFAVFSLEMTGQAFKNRFVELNPHDWESLMESIYIADISLSPEEVSARTVRAANHNQIQAVGVDFADLMLSADTSEQTMGNVYKVMARLAIQLNVTVFLVSQLSRAYVSDGKVREPRPTDLRWTGLAEAMSSVLLMIHNPGQIYLGQLAESRVLPTIDGRAYILVAKSRFGFSRGKEPHDKAGALSVSWSGASGWGDDARWTDL